MKKDIVCITCPRGCTIHVEYDKDRIIAMEGYTCKRGAEYAKNEILEPKRMVTSSVKIENAKYPVLPCKTNRPVRKDLMFDVMKEVCKIEAHAPVKQGEVLIKNVCGTDADIIATQTLEKVK